MVILVKKSFERRLINAFMKKGKFVKAEKIYFTVLNRLTSLGIVNPYKFLRETVVKMTPVMGVVKKKERGKRISLSKIFGTKNWGKVCYSMVIKKDSKTKGI